MKMYHFRPKSYGYEWFVMSDSEDSAIIALNEHLNRSGNSGMQWGDPDFGEYDILVYGPNQVVESELV